MKRLFEMTTGYCPRCGAHYLEDIGESCRCPSHEPLEQEIRPEINKALLSKWQSGPAAL